MKTSLKRQKDFSTNGEKLMTNTNTKDHNIKKSKILSKMEPPSVKYVSENMEDVNHVIDVIKSYPDIAILDGLFGIFSENDNDVIFTSGLYEVYQDTDNPDEKRIIKNAFLLEHAERGLFYKKYLKQYQRARARYGLFEEPEQDTMDTDTMDTDTTDAIDESQPEQDTEPTDVIIYFDSIHKMISKDIHEYYQAAKNDISKKNFSAIAKININEELKDTFRKNFSILDQDILFMSKEKPENPIDIEKIVQENIFEPEKDIIIRALDSIHPLYIDVKSLHEKSLDSIKSLIKNNPDDLLEAKVYAYVKANKRKDDNINELKSYYKPEPDTEPMDAIDESLDNLDDKDLSYIFEVISNIPKIVKKQLFMDVTKKYNPLTQVTETVNKYNPSYQISLQNDDTLSENDILDFMDKVMEGYNKTHEKLSKWLDYDYNQVIKNQVITEYRKGSLIPFLKQNTVFKNGLILENVYPMLKDTYDTNDA